MPFSGNLLQRLYNWVTDRDLGIKILASKMDGEFDNVFDGVNQVLQGNVDFSGQIKNISGTVTAPAYTFTGDLNTGLFRIGADKLGITAGGTLVNEYSSTDHKLFLKVILSLTGNITAGTNSGLIISSHTPSIIFNDITSGHGDWAMYVDNGVLKIMRDTQNDLQVGNSSNTSDEDIIELSTTAFNYKGNKVMHVGNDGAGSLFDADLLDGQHGSFYQNASNLNAGEISDARLPLTISSNITGNANTATTATTATNATQLNGQVASFYQNASNINSGTLSSARLPATIGADTTGTASNADALDGQSGTFYRNASNLTAGTVPDARLPIKADWTPTGVTSVNEAYYIKIGNLVTVVFDVVMTSDNTIGNLPFAPVCETPFVVRNTFTGTGGATKNGYDFARIGAGSTTITIDHTTASDGDTIRGSVTYII